MDFRDAGGKDERALAKQKFLEEIAGNSSIDEWMAATFAADPQYRELLESMHPRIQAYSSDKQDKAYDAVTGSHPKFTADLASAFNQWTTIPNHATSIRKMEPFEQLFLTNAMRRIREDVANRPFHIHGESGVLGDENGNVTWFGHSPEGKIGIPVMPDYKFVLHSHPPFMEPATSSASELDHEAAADSYLKFKAMEYVTNGKDVLHIRPDSLELVRLHPDPSREWLLGKFSEAFQVPDPQRPPRPVSKHEAPAAFPEKWLPPAGWTPPADYPRAQTDPGDGEPSTSRKRPRLS
jgi:hypothetical protein